MDEADIVAAVMNESDALVIALDGAGRILRFNPACERATGFARSDVVGQTVWDALVPSDERPNARMVFDKLVASLERSAHESDWLTKSGERRRIVWRNAALHDVDSGGVIIIGTGVDITDLRESERSLRDRAARLESLLKASRDGVITILESGEVTSFSSGAEKLFGFEAKDVIGRNVSMLMPEPYRSAHDGYVGAYVSTGDAKIIGLGREVTAKRKDGSTFPIHLMVEEGRLGETRFFTGVIRDLSERRAVERSLREKESQFETVFNAVPEVMVIADTAGRIVACNPAFESVFKIAPAAVVGREKRTLFESDEAYERQWTTLWSHNDGKPSHPIVVSFRRGDGEVFPGETVSAALRDADGTILGYLALIRDVSEEQRREEALRQAQKMEAIGQLTGGMAHDFNNLLTVIKGNLEMAVALVEGDVRELIEEAHGAADMGASLTGRMLAFARRQPLKPQPVDMNALIVSLSDLLRRTLGERIRLSTSLAPRIPPVLVDPAQLQNAILNLALNARDAMPDGGALAIESAVLAAPDEALLAGQPAAAGGFVALTVSDTGKGIAPHIKDRLFEPYATTKAAGKGGGLGLAMVYGFITQSGGAVAVASEPDRGASFTLYLPQAEASLEEAVAVDGAAGAMAGGGETVLVVEDAAAVRRLTCRRLESLGYSVLEAADAREALSHVDGGAAFDLLFTDVIMPGELDGPGLAAAVRSRLPDAKVLFTSGFVDPTVFDRSSAAIGADLLRKPYSLAELAAKLREALRP